MHFPALQAAVDEWQFLEPYWDGSSEAQRQYAHISFWLLYAHFSAKHRPPIRLQRPANLLAYPIVHATSLLRKLTNLHIYDAKFGMRQACSASRRTCIPCDEVPRSFEVTKYVRAQQRGCPYKTIFRPRTLALFHKGRPWMSHA
jgi:hypothetical protein